MPWVSAVGFDDLDVFKVVNDVWGLVVTTRLLFV